MLVTSQIPPFYNPTALLYQFISLLLKLDLNLMMFRDWTLEGISGITLLKQE